MAGVTVQWTGANFALVSRELRAADPKLRLELSKDLRKISKPIVDELRQSVRGTSSQASGGSVGYGSAQRALKALSRGRLTERRVEREVGRAGLRDTIARAIRQYQRDRGNDVGFMIRVNTANLPADQRRLPRYMNRGSWRHPVFGNREAWVQQTVTPAGWFNTVAQRSRPEAITAVNHTLDQHAARLARRLEAAG